MSTVAPDFLADDAGLVADASALAVVSAPTGDAQSGDIGLLALDISDLLVDPGLSDPILEGFVEALDAAPASTVASGDAMASLAMPVAAASDWIAQSHGVGEAWFDLAMIENGLLPDLS